MGARVRQPAADPPYHRLTINPARSLCGGRAFRRFWRFAWLFTQSDWPTLPPDPATIVAGPGDTPAAISALAKARPHATATSSSLW